MGILETDPPKKYLELIAQFRLIDDTFFDVCFDGSNACMQLLLRIFFARDDIIVKEVVTGAPIHWECSCRTSSAMPQQKCTIRNWLNVPTFSNIKKRGLVPCVK